jgi:hypothetical protein
VSADTVRIREIARAVERIKPIIAGRPAKMQGAILADLLAIWLAEHRVVGDEDATRTMRAELLKGHIAVARKLMTVNAGAASGRADQSSARGKSLTPAQSSRGQGNPI